MRAVRSRGNKDTELALAGFFRRHRVVGWRRNRSLFGKPDFLFPKLRVAVFVDGCFWHLCPKHSSIPANNRGYWKKKLSANRARDRLVTRTLRGQGWRVLRIWEHELARGKRARLLRRIQRELE